MTTITGYTASMIVMDQVLGQPTERKYQVRAYDNMGCRVNYLSGQTGALDEQWFADADEVREKLTGPIIKHNEFSLFPVSKLEVYFVDKFAEADIEDIMTVRTEPGIGEFKPV